MEEAYQDLDQQNYNHDVEERLSEQFDHPKD